MSVTEWCLTVAVALLMWRVRKIEQYIDRQIDAADEEIWNKYHEDQPHA